MELSSTIFKKNSLQNEWMKPKDSWNNCKHASSTAHLGKDKKDQEYVEGSTVVKKVITTPKLKWKFSVNKLLYKQWEKPFYI